LFLDYPSSSLFPLFRPEEKLRGFLFRNSDSGIENQLYRYNGALDRGGHARGGGVETKGMLKRAYFIALIMNEDALSQMAATTNTGIRYLNCDAVDRRTEAEPRSAGDDRGGRGRRIAGEKRMRQWENEMEVAIGDLIYCRMPHDDDDDDDDDDGDDEEETVAFARSQLKGSSVAPLP